MFSVQQTIAGFDPELANAMTLERRRQEAHIELIASENYASPRVLEAQGSVLTNKYAEGYPGKRYYGGCEHVDVTEQLAIDRACRLFGAKFANVQPHSGAQANMAVQFALMKPGETLNAIPYGVREEDQRIDYDAVAELARDYHPKLIIAGGSAYPRQIDFAR